METTQPLNESALPDAIGAVGALAAHPDQPHALMPDAHRLAFADPEFLLRRETRGIRFQLELLKPDLALQAQGIDNTIVVYGSARFRSQADSADALARAEAAGDARAVAQARQMLRNARYYEQAREFGALVARHSERCRPADKLYVCTGGGPGIMEAANRGAHEAGGRSVGLCIALPREEHPNPYIPRELNFKFHYFALRKMHFMMRAKALVAFPGGFGTLDELFEVLTLVQTRKAKAVPIFLYGSDYWRRLIDFQVLVDEGAISQEDLALFRYVDDPQQTWDAIRDFYGIEEQPA